MLDEEYLLESHRISRDFLDIPHPVLFVLSPNVRKLFPVVDKMTKRVEFSQKVLLRDNLFEQQVPMDGN